MAIHLLRDYFQQNVSNANGQYVYSYTLTIFLRRVLGYKYVGDTNYPINAVGSLLIATGDATPTADIPTFPIGSKAGINLGTQKEFYVSIPVSVRTVSGADLGRILVLKSTANPRFNSGLFVIVGFEASTNSYVIDYRTLGDPPPVEAADSLQWWLYERDINAPTSGTVNTKGSTEYRSDGNSTTPRIILQSPHSLGWQVRICHETVTDQTNNCPAISVSPGFNGNSSGDFIAFGQHFHAPLWYNSSSTLYYGGAPGMGGSSTGIQYRLTICGDDTGQGVIMYCRRQNNSTTPSSNILVFGLPENETTPLPVNNYARLFCVGSAHTTGGALRTNDGGLQVGSIDQNNPSTSAGYSQGMSASPFGTPVAAGASMWAYISGGGQGSGIQTDTFATDNPYTSTTDLLPIDVVQGMLGNWFTTAGTPFPFAPRIMGTMPHIRQGRQNFGDFSPTTDFARSYQHLRRGLYIPWNGPNMIP
jgi:hypothetical protein